MKRKILLAIGAAAVVLLAASCQQEEFPAPDAGGTQPLAITVTDGGYAPSRPTAGGRTAEAPQTRAAEAGYTTRFTAGDACGLYIVRRGKVVYENVKLTAADGDGGLVWQPQAGVTLVGGFQDEAYYLYYPYQADMTGKTASTPTVGMSDAAFFAPLISGWKPKADQSEYTPGYTAADLMTAAATANKNGKTIALSFAMTHRMALAVVELPSIKYVFSNIQTKSDYTVPIVADFTESQAKPCRMADGTYRYIVNPATAPEITGSYADGKKEFAFIPSATSGSYKTYKIDGGSTATVEQTYTLQVGDYLLADGNLLPKDKLTDKQKNKVSAIVFWTPAETTSDGRQTPASLESDKIMQAHFPDCTHGLAVSLKDVPGDMAWQSSYEFVKDFQSGDHFNPDNKDDFRSVASGTGATDPINYILGYQNTRVLLAYNDYCTDNEKTDYIVRLAAALADFANKNPAPSKSTGWFLPSVKELHILCNKDVDNVWNETGTDTRSIVNKSLTAAAGETFADDYYYWSSSEYAGGSGYAFLVYFSSASVSGSLKDRTRRVRAVCAF